MFVGHYAAAFALKGKESHASLGMLFLATKLVDILYFPFAVLGLEKLEFVEGYTEVNNFQMEFPLTHGLLGTLFWAFMIYALYYYGIKRRLKRRKQLAWVMAIAVLSHWFIDLIAHSPDLPIIEGEPKFGFGLWYYKDLSFWVEGLLLLVGWIYYMYNTKSKTIGFRIFAIAFIFFLILINYLNYYVLPQNDDLMGLTVSALLSYFFLAFLAHLMDRGRIYAPA